MPDWIAKAFEHSPDLAALIGVVLFFLKFTTRLLDSHAKRTDEFIETVKEINSQHAQALHDTRSAIDRQANSAEQMRDAVRVNTEATKQLSQSFERATEFFKRGS